MPTLSVNDLSIHYQHHTTNTTQSFPLLMLSGMASDSASWQPVVNDLAAHFELLIPDNRCTGRTQPNPVETNRELMVDDLIALLDKLSIERVNILGHSMGAMLGWALAARAPERINHLISASAQSSVIPARIALFDSLAQLRTPHNEPDWFRLLYQFLFSPSFFTQPAAISQAVAASMAYPYKQDATSFRTQATALSSFIAPPDRDSVQCRVSLVTGANDLLMTPALMKSFAESHHDSYTIIDDAAHAIHWEQPQQVVQFVLGELNGKNVGPATSGDKTRDE